jgi:ADP-ribosyl-[dinitrogen reductase] hydrolase
LVAASFRTGRSSCHDNSFDDAARIQTITDSQRQPSAKAGMASRVSWRGKSRAEIKASGYVAHTLEAVIWSVARTPNS